MNTRIAALLLLVTLAAGCRSAASTCVSVCTEITACRGAARTDCTASCAEYISLDAVAGCAAPFDALLRCQSSLPDVCKGDPCNDASNAWRACLQPYCAKNPATAGCK